MIVCRECGTQNADGDLFCGGCPAFLEHSGEHIPDELPMPAPEEADEREGIVTRIRHALSGDQMPPPTGAPRDVSASLPSTAPEPQLDEEQRRAHALVAKPVEEELAAPTGSAATPTGARTPQPVAPQAPRPRPKRVAQPPSRKILPGDLICGACGEGNPDTRKFCRRCGNSLVEAEVQKAVWWKRLVPRRKKKILKVTERPDRGTGRNSVGTKGRILRGKVLGRFADVRRMLALLALVGIGVGFAIPSARTAMVDGVSGGLGKVRRIISPTYSNIPIDPARVSASSEAAGAEAVRVTDNNTLTYWEATADDPSASVTVRFVEPTDVEHVLVHPGKQENGGKVVRPDPRPRELLFRVLDEDGLVTEVPALLEDVDGFQTITLQVDRAVSVETMVVNCFPDPVVTVCPVTELAFQSKD